MIVSDKNTLHKISCIVDSYKMRNLSLRHVSLVCMSRSHFVLHELCDVTNKDESKVGNDMLLVILTFILLIIILYFEYNVDKNQDTERLQL